MNTCDHKDISGCDAKCACICDACQAVFESNWQVTVTDKDLCPDCGVPVSLTPDNLLSSQYTHFFDPCPICAPYFKICMKMASLCETCHSHIDGECRLCVCKESVECECRECRRMCQSPTQNNPQPLQ